MECWRCLYPFEAHTPAAEPRQADPVEGDVSLCWQCGNVGIFRRVDGALVVCPPTPKEVEELSTDLGYVQQAAEFELARRAARRDTREKGKSS